MTVDWKKKLLPNLPYLLFVYLFVKLCRRCALHLALMPLKSSCI